MGKTMAKGNVIWGEQHSVSLASFSNANMLSIIDLVRQKIGPKAAINQPAAQSAVLKAKANKKMKNGYVKVGLIGTDLILRCKEKKFLGDIEVDAILVKDYPVKVTAWSHQKLLDDLDKIEQAGLQRQKREKAQREEQERKAKALRLHKVMNTPDEEGDTMRTKLLRAADKAQKLGVGDYAKEKLKAQGLQPMHEDYHGEVLDHQKNRYGRYLPQLRKVWEDKGPGKGSFSKWLDDVEASKTTVAGVTEALALTHPEVGKIVKPGGIAGGRVINLDDDTRKAYLARASKGTLTGPSVGNGDLIFVIGPDSKVYVGRKARAQPGQLGAFNHSSFFSGGPVKSAGSLKVSGGRITEISDLSGHYTPTKAMVLAAIRKFGAGDPAWQSQVQVKLGTASPVTARALLDEDHETTTNDTWGKYSAGAVSRPDAARVLMAAADGNWLVRLGSNSKLVISYRKGDTVEQDELTAIGSKRLDRKKLLLPGQVKSLLASLPKITSTPKPSRDEREQDESESQEKPVRPGRTTRTPRQQTPPTPETTTTDELTPSQISGMRTGAGWHGDLNRVGSEGLLRGKPGAWLLREGSGGAIAFSYNEDGTLKHMLMNTPRNYSFMQEFSRRNRGAMIPA